MSPVTATRRVAAEQLRLSSVAIVSLEHIRTAQCSDSRRCWDGGPIIRELLEDLKRGTNIRACLVPTSSPRSREEVGGRWDRTYARVNPARPPNSGTLPGRTAGRSTGNKTRQGSAMSGSTRGHRAAKARVGQLATPGYCSRRLTETEDGVRTGIANIWAAPTTGPWPTARGWRTMLAPALNPGRLVLGGLGVGFPAGRRRLASGSCESRGAAWRPPHAAIADYLRRWNGPDFGRPAGRLSAYPRIVGADWVEAVAAWRRANADGRESPPGFTHRAFTALGSEGNGGGTSVGRRLLMVVPGTTIGPSGQKEVPPVAGPQNGVSGEQWVGGVFFCSFFFFGVRCRRWPTGLFRIGELVSTTVERVRNR